jgi:alpha-amylase/alpha-mannosidase (GH57 family)
VLSHSDFKFHTPNELSKLMQPVSPIYVPYPISWADEERDLTAWLGNDLQDDAFNKLYEIEDKVKRCNDPAIQRDWKYLQTSDHFYYMCTKWFSDGDVHKYFNPYNTPYEAFINYMNILSDFLIRINEVCPGGTLPDVTEKEVEVVEKTDKKTTPAKKVAKKVAAKKPAAKKAIAKKIIKKAAAVVKKETKTPVKEKAVAKKKIPTVKGHELKLFDNISRKVIKTIFKDFDSKTLAMALAGADKDTEEKVKSAIGQGAGRRLATAIKHVVAPKAIEIKEARQQIEEMITEYFAKLK